MIRVRVAGLAFMGFVMLIGCYRSHVLGVAAAGHPGTDAGHPGTDAGCLGREDAVEIAVGSGHTCARRASGQVVCWAWNIFGQLGDGTTTDRLTFVNVAPFP